MQYISNIYICICLILFNKNFPDGTFKKNLNSSKIYNLGWRPKIKLKDGLKEVINLRLN